MKIITIVGARPQFIKAAAVSREIARHPQIKEIIIHTGQHYDANMSDIFFEQMQIPKPDYNLDINGLSHGAMTGQMLEKIEQVLIKENPDCVLVYGDTNSTLAGALAAKKLHIKVAHVEAGLRSFNMQMPEEINRILTDRISDFLFCPTATAVKNLEHEKFGNFGCTITQCGDVMQDAALFYTSLSKAPSELKLPQKYILATIHRAENTDNQVRLTEIVNALNAIAKEIDVIIPIHPRTRKILQNNNLKIEFTMIDPVGYLEMIYLITHAECIMTDSGGLQKEAFFFKKPCITLRDETEWIELIEHGCNILAGANSTAIINAYIKMRNHSINFFVNLYGKGEASKRIVSILLDKIGKD